MIKLFKNLKKIDIIYGLIAIIFIVFQVYLDLKMPDYMSKITVLVQSEVSELDEVLKYGGYMMACAFGSMLSAVITGYLISTVSARFSKNVGRKLFDKVTSFSSEEINEFSTPSLITRNTNDITQVQMFLAMGLQMLIKSPITAIWAINKILDKSWQWSAATSVAVVFLLVVVGIIMAIVVPKFKLVQNLIDKLNRVTRENLIGIRVIRAFNAEKYQEEKFEEVNADLTNLQTFNQKMFALMMPIMFFVMNFLALAIYFIGSRLIDGAMIAEKIELFGNMVVFSSYAMQVIMSFLMLAFIFMMLPRANVSADRINEVLNTKIQIEDGKKSYKDNGIRGKVEFQNVYFSYPDAEEAVLENISFTANRGETVAFIGSTGSGKSTLINLIPRFYDVSGGKILVDGIDVRDYPLKDLYNKLGYVSQKAFLFNESIENNINFGEGLKEISDKDIDKALEIAQASEFVNKMDDGKKSMIAQSGTNISGGQKQRLSIARAIAKDPEIFIFDDSFSALDYKTDAILRNELKKSTENSTKLIVAQRIGTIMNADEIIVLDQGKIVGKGRHKELLENCDVYREIALSQLSEEELYNG
ncbi:ABC transporter ATP-binding protein [Anaerococcus vaginalis]|uniref:ABC transporter, ATP-binding protein n=2 Tax=Anaerococcus vaginalis TaxID=33037 RepID=C7HUM1_9FIRM|nr:ABC transporter ATP-binding protein [Anaerococcus vaginalis]EEU12527.1 ABC transporter, ATP-binding protein [Anaerococcus vaginalis ATCC 51170]QQB61343.1 ABC transporter ATP-binding protein [Anaerococcus vaginalis]